MAKVVYYLVGQGAHDPVRHLGVALDLWARLPNGSKRVWGMAKIPTGVALLMPTDMAVRITGRSGNFLRGIIVHDGLVETEFDGEEICALVYCPWPRIIRDGQRIAQMWPITVDRDALEYYHKRAPGNGFTLAFETPMKDAFDATPSGKKGFGSTGR